MFIILVVTQLSYGQLWKSKRWYLTGAAGPSFFFGDVGGYSQSINILGFKDLTFLQTRFNVNANVKFRFMQDINGRVSFTYGMLHATDERGSNQERGFEATMNFFEPVLMGEYYFIKNRTERSWLFIKRRNSTIGSFFKALDFYFLTGIGGISYSIKPNDALAATNPDLKGFAPVIPFGVGSSIILTPEIDLGFEVAARYAFTDYLDGYTSQYSNSNDVYYFMNFTFTYKLKTSSRGWPSFR
jgi:hypothetical protein